MVGSGTLLPDADRGSASFHVASEGHALLLDVGAGALHGLARAGLDWRAIDTIAISHYHTDHFADLPPLLAAFRFVGATRPLTLVGPAGFTDFLERMAGLHGPWILDPSRPLSVVELGRGGAWTPPGEEIQLTAAPTPHTDESVAFRVSSGPVSLGYTGDTGPSGKLHDFLRGCTVIVAECALADPPEIDTHLSPRSVAELASAAEPELLLLSHVYPPQSSADAVGDVARRYGGRVRAAFDGMRVRIDSDGVAVDPLPGAL